MSDNSIIKKVINTLDELQIEVLSMEISRSKISVMTKEIVADSVLEDLHKKKSETEGDKEMLGCRYALRDNCLYFFRMVPPGSEQSSPYPAPDGRCVYSAFCYYHCLRRSPFRCPKLD